MSSWRRPLWTAGNCTRPLCGSLSTPYLRRNCRFLYADQCRLRRVILTIIVHNESGDSVQVIKVVHLGLHMMTARQARFNTCLPFLQIHHPLSSIRSISFPERNPSTCQKECASWQPNAYTSFPTNAKSTIQGRRSTENPASTAPDRRSRISIPYRMYNPSGLASWSGRFTRSVCEDPFGPCSV